MKIYIKEIYNARKAVVQTPPLFYYNTLGWSVSFNLGNVAKLCRNTVRKGDKSIPTVTPILSLQSDFEHNVTVLNCGSVCQAIVWQQHLHSCYCFTGAAATQTCDGVGGRHSRATLALCYTKETYWDNSPHVLCFFFFFLKFA